MEVENREGGLKIEVCYSPALFPYYENRNAVVVVTDILRASSAIVTAFMNGVERIIPVGTLEEAKSYKERGFMVAAERDGIVRDFADFGNSPYNFTPERVKGNQIVYSTTNGTNAIQLASSGSQVLIGAYLNITALADHIKKSGKDLLILCAGWKNKFNLEDTLFAGALSKMVLEDQQFFTICDATLGAMDLYEAAESDMLGYIEKVAQRHRLKKNKLDDVIAYCHEFDRTRLIPVLERSHLVPLPDLI
ncbi:MAG: 2-phosphosulfolactate phosphatase [Bacteroidales bacterium]|nr:2-phosphosulfolactate phosphatase [Bacteroidales bacterium]